MKRNLIVALGLFFMMTGVVFSNGTAESGDEQLGGELTVLTNAEGATGLDAAIEAYNELYPDIDLEATVYSDDAAKNAIIAAKVASGDLPDVILSVINSLTVDLAKKGYLLPLTNTGFQDRLSDIEYPLGWYNNDVYCIPMNLSVSGLFANDDLLKEYGIADYPQSLDELVAICDQLQKAGLEEPLLVAAKEVNPVNAFVYQYIYQNLYGSNPDWYADLLTGDGRWSDDDFKAVYYGYGRLKPYMNKDALGLDDSGSIRRFASGQNAFMVGSNFGSNIRIANPDLNYSIIPGPFNETKENFLLTTDAGQGFSITADSENQDLAIKLLDFLTTAEGAGVFSKAIGNFSSVMGVSGSVDPAGDYLQGLLSSGFPTTRTMTRTWIPGIKEYMKKGTQEWFVGGDVDTIAAGIEKEHQRLMKASPDFVESFLADHKFQ
ncbi:extracellular solute-binding protein [Oceanispirochaeta crateris]|uniref:Extracellular solute-binding protein n=1 Tax=Oceanispirochaeta crateris TaxID=2518645 RepID=A0A5C1QS87_9SPIO|nr:extracellular solute-binding protein [Oceanispirochaeta crateris]QEN09436.1 extracellular solute-binding protein [Oceanispirochaeta crateris]